MSRYGVTTEVRFLAARQVQSSKVQISGAHGHHNNHSSSVITQDKFRGSVVIFQRPSYLPGRLVSSVHLFSWLRGSL